MRERYVVILLLILLVIYNAQGIGYEVGSIVSQLSLVVIHVIAFIYFFKTILTNERKSLFFKAWSVLLFLNIFGLIFTGSISNPIHFSMFKGILMSLLVFYPFYYFSRHGLIKENDLIFFLLIVIPVYILQFYITREQILFERLSDNLNVVNNIAYDFVWLIPFAFLLKKYRILSVILILIIMFFIIQGAKRGAIIIGGVGMLFYIFFLLRTVSKRNRIKGYIISFIGVILIGIYAYDFFTKNEFLMERLQQLEIGGYSGRNTIYTNLFNAWYASDNFFNLLFGYGFASSVTLSGTGNLAHNDWLELLTNFGLLGLSLYFILIYSGFKEINFDWSINKKLMIGVVMVMWLLTSLFSMGYTIDNGYLKAMLLGYLLGDGNNKISRFDK